MPAFVRWMFVLHVQDRDIAPLARASASGKKHGNAIKSLFINFVEECNNESGVWNHKERKGMVERQEAARK